MKMLNDMKVGAKIVLLVAALIICLAVVAGVGMFGLRQLDDESTTMYEVDLFALQSAKEANIQLINISRAVRNMTLAQNSEQRVNYKRAYDSFAVIAHEQLALVKDRIASPEGEQIFTATVKSFNELLVQQQKIIDDIENRAVHRGGQVYIQAGHEQTEVA